MIAALKDRKQQPEVSRTATPTPAPQLPIVCAIPGKTGHYFVESDNKQFAFLVIWDGINGKCTCQTYTTGIKTNSAFQCGHILAAKKCPPPTTATIASEKTEAKIDEILNRPFTADKIHTKPDGTKYIEAVNVIERLNEAFGNTGWSFFHKEPIEADETQEVVCSGKIEAHINNRTVCKEHSGSCRYDTELSYGEARTGSIQMALKKCASLFGIGLKQLYTNEPPRAQEVQGSIRTPFQTTRGIQTYKDEIPF